MTMDLCQRKRSGFAGAVEPAAPGKAAHRALDTQHMMRV